MSARVAFGDVVRQVKDKVDPVESGLERYVAGEHMDTDDLRIRRWGDIGDGYLGPAFHMRFKPGHVLYGSRRTYLRKVAVADFEGITANTTYVLESRNPKVLLPELLPFIMQTEAFHKHSIQESRGSVNPYVNFSDLATFEFALPPMEEQRRLVEVLRAAQALLEALLILEKQSRAMWLTAIQSIQCIASSRVIELGSLIHIIEPGKSVIGVEREPQNDEYAVLKISAVDPLGFQPNESKVLINQEDFQAQYQVRAGDLLITRSNTSALVGETCLVSSDYPRLMLCDKTLRLVPHENVSSKLIWHLMQGNDVRQQISSVATGTGGAMKNISQPKIRAIQINYPHDATSSARIESLLDTCFKAYRDVGQRRRSIELLRDALLEQGLSGACR